MSVDLNTKVCLFVCFCVFVFVFLCICVSCFVVCLFCVLRFGLCSVVVCVYVVVCLFCVVFLFFYAGYMTNKRQNKAGATPLHHAVSAEHASVIAVLVASGADSTIR